MGSMPLCLRYGRIIIDNASHLNKIIQPTMRVNNSMCFKHWSTNNGSLFRCHKKLMSTTAVEEKDKTPQPGGTQDGNAECDPTIKKQIDQLAQEVDNLTKQTKELTDKYKRALADGENLRLRLTKQIEDAKLFGIQGFCKDLLEVADILGKATECVPKEEVSDSNPHLKNLYEGLTMTEAELQKVFKRHGLVPVNPLNEKFDPNLHEALFQQEVEGKAPGTVVVVSKIGYKLHERVVRPALVGVAKA